MSKIIQDVVETAMDLQVSESLLISLKDIQLDQSQETIAELEELVRKLTYALWYAENCCQGNKEACNNIEEALGSVPAKYIEFYI